MSIVTGPEGRLTPDQIRSAIFPGTRFGRRGVDEDHVRAFCEQVAEEFIQLLSERASLYQQAEFLREQLRDIGENSSPGYTPDAAQMQAVQILASAQKTADFLVAEAQDYCRRLAEGAKQRRNQMLSDARVNAAKMLEQADSQARAAAATMATAAATTAEAGNDGESRDLQDQVVYLRTFSEVYRTHLRAYLEALLRNVDEWDRSEHKAAEAAAQQEGLPARGTPRRLEKKT